MMVVEEEILAQRKEMKGKGERKLFHHASLNGTRLVVGAS